MTDVLHRDFNAPPPIATPGLRANHINGLLDLSSGAGVSCLGHECAPVKQAMIDQIRAVPYVHASAFTTMQTEMLASKMLAACGQSFDEGAVMFLNGGAEAVEAAVKLAMQCYLLVDRDTTVGLVTRAHSYHGNTWLTLAAGDHQRAQPFKRNMRDVAFRARDFVEDNDARDICWVLNGVPRDAVVLVETVGGMASMIEPPTKTYLACLRAACDARGALLIFDEVLCGNYRSGGEMFAWQHYGVEPDIVVAGKGLAGGYFPLSAVVVNNRVANALRPGGRVWHSTTNQNHPIGCAAALAALPMYDLHSATGSIRDLGAVLTRYEARLPLKCFGALAGLRLPAESVPSLRAALWRERIVVYTDVPQPGKGVALIAPPYSMTPQHLDAAMQIVEKTYREVVGDA